jgi:hypothetical protein
VREELDRRRVAGLRARLRERRSVLLVDEDTGAALLEPRGEPGVVAVRVGQHDGLDVAGLETASREVVLEGAAEGGQAGIDGGQRVPVLHDVPVHDVAPQAEDAGRDLSHR